MKSFQFQTSADFERLVSFIFRNFYTSNQYQMTPVVTIRVRNIIPRGTVNALPAVTRKQKVSKNTDPDEFKRYHCCILRNFYPIRTTASGSSSTFISLGLKTRSFSSQDERLPVFNLPKSFEKSPEGRPYKLDTHYFRKLLHQMFHSHRKIRQLVAHF